jgi:DNA replication and repair protein RecF
LVPDPNGLTVLTGPNGAGKTSLLEAVTYASTLTSFRGSPREALVRRGAERAVVRLEAADRERSDLIEIEIAPSGRDRVQRNRQRPRRGSDLLESLRTTVFSPDDLELVKGGPQGRRDFADEGLVAVRPRRRETKALVERVVRQRTALLRQSGGFASAELLSALDVWDTQLADAGSDLVVWREEFLSDLEPLAIAAYRQLTGRDDRLRLVYERSFADDLGEALSRARAEDLRRGVSTVGPHRDEIAVFVEDLDVRTRLSQGRQRSVTLALRLATHRLVTEAAGTAPVLLLDDAFSELDERTAGALFNELPPGQALLTTAGPLPPGAKPSATIEIVAGTIVE